MKIVLYLLVYSTHIHRDICFCLEMYNRSCDLCIHLVKYYCFIILPCVIESNVLMLTGMIEFCFSVIHSSRNKELVTDMCMAGDHCKKNLAVNLMVYDAEHVI